MEGEWVNLGGFQQLVMGNNFLVPYLCVAASGYPQVYFKLVAGWIHIVIAVAVNFGLNLGFDLGLVGLSSGLISGVIVVV